LRTFTLSLSEGFNRVLKPLPKYKDYQASSQASPILNGFWGGDLRTMTEQACELGIPSFQLEIPLRMRTALFANEALSHAFLEVILDTYHTVVVPWWATRKVPLLIKLDCSYGLKF
jgi:hypothetical protein